MIKHEDRVIAFPHMGNYYIAMKELGKVFDCKVVMAPPITKKTIELGAKHSPEFVCVPFKYNMGNFIEAIEDGANTIVMVAGGCRFGYYGEVQREILKSMGHGDVDFYHLGEATNPKDYLRWLKEINPKINLFSFNRALHKARLKMQAIEEIEDYVRKNIGFVEDDKGMEKLEKRFFNELDKAESVIQIKNVRQKYITELKNIPVDKPENLLRVGMVGELYVVMEPFSNYFIEKEMAKRGVEVHRFITASYLLFDKQSNKHHEEELIAETDGYLKYHIGADGLESVAHAVSLQKKGFDGLIHVKPFGCMPEVNAMSALQRLSKDKKFPIMYFSFDSQTSSTGIQTRLEAFHDMIIMKKEEENNGAN